MASYVYFSKNDLNSKLLIFFNIILTDSNALHKTKCNDDFLVVDIHCVISHYENSFLSEYCFTKLICLYLLRYCIAEYRISLLIFIPRGLQNKFFS
jgi:hypothetical protein